MASQIGDEAREVSPHNTLNLDFYSPTVNLERDPRWGRNDESCGEDPLPGTKEVAQFVNGMQGKDQSGRLLPAGGGYNKTIATIKHYAANNSEVNRRTGSSDMDQRTLREYYTKPFRGDHPAEPPGLDHELLQPRQRRPRGRQRPPDGHAGPRDVRLRRLLHLRLRRGVRDRGRPPLAAAVPGRARSTTSSATPTRSAGEDLDCNAGYNDGYNYRDALPTARPSRSRRPTGTFYVNDLDAALVRLFTARMKLGEFDDPATVPWVAQARSRASPLDSWVNSNANNAVTETPDRLALAQEAARQVDRAAQERRTGCCRCRCRAAGPYKVAVHGLVRQPGAESVPGRLLEHPGARPGRPTRSTATGHQERRSRRSTRTPRSTSSRASPARARRPRR